MARRGCPLKASQLSSTNDGLLSLRWMGEVSDGQDLSAGSLVYSWMSPVARGHRPASSHLQFALTNAPLLQPINQS